MKAAQPSRGWAFTINNPCAMPIETIAQDMKLVFATQLALAPHKKGLFIPTDPPADSKIETDEDVRSYLSTSLEQLLEAGGARYCVCGLEEGEVGLTPHFQGYIYFPTAKSMAQVVRLLRSSGLCPERYGHVWSSTRSDEATKRAYPHLEVARGTPEQNKVYCTKKDLWAEAGKMPKQGERTDLSTVGHELLAGLPLDEAIARYPGVAMGHLGNMQLLANRVLKPLMEPRTVVWFHGPTGCGKSRRAHEEAEKLSQQLGKPYFSRTGNSKWWCNYKGEEIVVLDDIFAGDAVMDTEELNFSDMLRLTDRYGTHVNQKGTSTAWQARYIIITCSVHPSKWALSKRYGTRDLQQLVRRINTIVEFKPAANLPVREPVEITAEWDTPLDLFPAPPPAPPVIEIEDDEPPLSPPVAGHKRPNPGAEEEEEEFDDDPLGAAEQYAAVRSPPPRRQRVWVAATPDEPPASVHYDTRDEAEARDVLAAFNALQARNAAIAEAEAALDGLLTEPQDWDNEE